MSFFRKVSNRVEWIPNRRRARSAHTKIPGLAPYGLAIIFVIALGAAVYIYYQGQNIIPGISQKNIEPAGVLEIKGFLNRWEVDGNRALAQVLENGQTRNYIVTLEADTHYIVVKGSGEKTAGSLLGVRSGVPVEIYTQKPLHQDPMFRVNTIMYWE